jgi:hypothetical protein
MKRLASWLNRQPALDLFFYWFVVVGLAGLWTHFVYRDPFSLCVWFAGASMAVFLWFGSEAKRTQARVQQRRREAADHIALLQELRE